jgi:hypothetical protein
LKIFFALAALSIWALVASCALLSTPALDAEPAAKARSILAQGDFVAATLTRRFADGRLLVRLDDGKVWVLDPKKTCSWCWMHVDRRVYVELGEHTSVLVSHQGERIECWNGGRMQKF